MKRIAKILGIILAAFVLWIPQTADAKAVGVLVMNMWRSEPIYNEGDDFLQMIEDITKEYVPYGYTVTCNHKIMEDFGEADRAGYNYTEFAQVYGYDFLILVFPDKPYVNVTHFRHPRGNADIYEVSRSVIGVMYTQDGTWYKLGVSHRDKQQDNQDTSDLKIRVFQHCLRDIYDKFQVDMEEEDKKLENM